MISTGTNNHQRHDLSIHENVARNVTMSSREIAELTGKEHFHVKRDIEHMLKELGKDASSFGGIYLDSMNRQQTEYRLDRELTETLVTGYSIPLRHKVIQRLHQLEAELAQPRELSRMDLIMLAMDSEKARLAAEAERDLAIATKALIGSRREATAMATASVAAKKARQLEQELGRGTQHATIIAVEKASGRKFGAQGFRPLKSWCQRHDVAAPKVPCPRYGKAVSWPAQAWLAVYSVDLGALFGEEVAA